MDRSSLHVLQYYKALNYAMEILRSYGVECLESKEAHDFAMDCMVEKGSCNMKYIRMRIIDALRRQMGRKSKGRKEIVRNWVSLTSSIIDDTPERPVDIDELLMQFNMTTKEHFILSMVCCGVGHSAIGQMLGVSYARVSQIVIAVSDRIRISGVYNVGFYGKKQDNGARRRYLKRMTRPMRTWRLAHDGDDA
jgi:hypothetical protein